MFKKRKHSLWHTLRVLHILKNNLGRKELMDATLRGHIPLLPVLLVALNYYFHCSVQSTERAGRMQWSRRSAILVHFLTPSIFQKLHSTNESICASTPSLRFLLQDDHVSALVVPPLAQSMFGLFTLFALFHQPMKS